MKSDSRAFLMVPVLPFYIKYAQVALRTVARRVRHGACYVERKRRGIENGHHIFASQIGGAWWHELQELQVLTLSF